MFASDQRERTKSRRTPSLGVALATLLIFSYLAICSGCAPGPTSELPQKTTTGGPGSGATTVAEPPQSRDARSDAGAQGIQVDPELPGYRPVTGVSGNITSVGSDTMNNLMTLWSEGFKKFYPAVGVTIEGKGSSTAPPALIAGTTTFGPMSREWKPAEADDFERSHGYRPVALGVSVDMLAVYVNKDNPLTGLTLAEADAIFSSTRRLGLAEDITRWGQLGLDGDWRDAPISLYGRNSASGTYGYFKEYVLGEGDYKNSVKEQPGSSSVVQSVASDLYGIGYSGIGYKTADVRAIPLAESAGGDYIEPVAANAERYPLARFLLLSLNYQPGGQLDPLRREFIKFVYSKEGQQNVVKDAYIPVSTSIARRQLEQVGIEPDF